MPSNTVQDTSTGKMDDIRGSIHRKWCYFGNWNYQEWTRYQKYILCDFDDTNSHLDAVLYRFEEVLIEELVTKDKNALKERRYTNQILNQAN